MNDLSKGIIKFSSMCQITFLFRLEFQIFEKELFIFHNATSTELSCVIRKRPEVENLKGWKR